jgi:hypothetical protein
MLWNSGIDYLQAFSFQKNLGECFTISTIKTRKQRVCLRNAARRNYDYLHQE